jgi:tRNA (cmo5U34)-methyltransferase
MRDNIFNKPNDLINFCFNDDVVKVFDDMVLRSVPGYRDTLEFIKLISQTYAKKGTNLYDLGCSTGSTSIALGSLGDIIAVDNSQAMLDKAKKNLSHLDNITYICDDIENITITNASIVVLNLTLQFINKEHREALIQNIYHGLISGGVLIISEKVHFEHTTTQEFFTDLHLQFKKLNGYSELEIANKRQLLEGVLRTDSEKIHLQRLSDCGFNTCYKVSQYLNFQTFIAIK